MRDVLLIGEAPGRGDGAVLAGRCGARLAALAGVTLAGFLDVVDRINVLARWPGPAPSKGSAFPMASARARAAELAATAELRTPSRVVLVGGRVAAAFRISGELFSWRSMAGWGFPSSQRWAIIPHPSGVNRWWNDDANVERARAFMRDLIERGRAVGPSGPNFGR